MLMLLVVLVAIRVVIAAASLGFDVYIRRQYRNTVRTRRHVPHVDTQEDFFNDDIGPWHVVDEYRGHRIIRHSHHFHIIENVSGEVVEQEPINDLEHAFRHVDTLVGANNGILSLMQSHRSPS